MRAGRDKSRNLIGVEPDAKVTEVIGVLKMHGISQVPVVQDGKPMAASRRDCWNVHCSGTGTTSPS